MSSPAKHSVPDLGCLDIRNASRSLVCHQVPLSLMHWHSLPQAEPFQVPPVAECNFNLAVCTFACPLFGASFACEICPLIDSTCTACSLVACNALCTTVCRCLQATLCSFSLSNNTVYRLSGSRVFTKMLMWCKCTLPTWHCLCPAYQFVFQQFWLVRISFHSCKEQRLNHAE